MAYSFWTQPHTHYGIGICLILLAGAIIGSMYNDVFTGLYYGAGAAVVYCIVRVILWIRKH